MRSIRPILEHTITYLNFGWARKNVQEFVQMFGSFDPCISSPLPTSLLTYFLLADCCSIPRTHMEKFQLRNAWYMKMSVHIRSTHGLILSLLYKGLVEFQRFYVQVSDTILMSNLLDNNISPQTTENTIPTISTWQNINKKVIETNDI